MKSSPSAFSFITGMTLCTKIVTVSQPVTYFEKYDMQKIKGVFLGK